jgi:hypothetical protein
LAQIEIGVARPFGRGKNAKQVKETCIVMPDKLPALIKLLDHVSRVGNLALPINRTVSAAVTRAASLEPF